MFVSILMTIFVYGFFVSVYSHRLGRNGVMLLILFFHSVFLLISVVNVFLFFPKILILYSFYWFSNFYIDFCFYLNFFSFYFVFLIILITFCVLLFSFSYMYSDIRFGLFCGFISLFMFFMLILVSSNNLIFLFVGWEGVGVLSFLLINYWFFRLESNKSALKALLFNRIGDAGFVIFMVYIFKLCSTVDISILWLQQDFSFYFVTFFFLAVCGKSAQLFLYAWLPDAMEGPTPVSSLLHSATMVTAGVFLTIRCFDLLIVIPNAKFFFILLLCIGSFTSLLTGIFAVKKYDIKKIIAFSTCSQLGLLFAGIGLGLINESFFYLFIHAFFKCLLFVSSGVVIHLLFNEQDIRRLSSSFAYVPLFYLFTVCGILSMCGFFFFSGYYSKEILLIGSLLGEGSLKSFLFLSSIFTILYSVRFFFFCFGNLSECRLPFSFFIKVKETSIDFFHLFAMFILFAGSLILGYFVSDTFLNYEIGYKWYPSIAFELSSHSILLLMFLVFIYLLFVCAYIQFKTQMLSVFFLKIFHIINNYISVEFFFSSFYFCISSLSNFLFYRYILLCFDRLMVDGTTIFFWDSALKTFYNKMNNSELTVSINSMFFSIFILCLLLFFSLLFSNLYIFLVASLFSLDVISKKKKANG